LRASTLVSGSSHSSSEISLKKNIGRTNPKILPKGIERAPIVVAIAHSLSPNHTVANLEGPLITKAIPIAATV